MSNKQTISFWSSVLMSLNMILGAGVYIAPQAMAQVAGQYSVWGWALVAVVLLPVVWCFAYAAKSYPEAGGFLMYGTRSIGQPIGFLATWAYLLGYMGTVCALSTAVCEIAYAQSGNPIFVTHSFAIAAGVVLFFSLLNLVDMALIGKIQSGAALVKIVPLAMVIVLMFFYASPTGAVATGFVPFDLVYTIPLTIFGYCGIELCCNIAHLIEGGPSRAAQATFFAFGLAASLYTFFHMGLMRIMGLEAMSRLGAVGFPSFLGLSPALTNGVQSFITFAIVFSAVNTMYGAMVMNVNSMHDLISRGLLPGAGLFGYTNKAGRPVLLVLLQAVAALSMIRLINNTQVFMALVGLGLCTAFSLIVLSMWVTAWRRQGQWLARLISTIALGSCAVLVAFSWLKISDDPSQRLLFASPVLATFVFGFVLYLAKTSMSCCATKK